MTSDATPTTVTPAVVPPPATGLKAKANELGMQAYLKAPKPAQDAMLKGFLAAQPVVAKVQPHAKKLVGGGLGLLALRRLRRR